MNTKYPVWIVLFLTAWLAPSLLLAADDNAPNIGYVYPAGGRRGTTFDVIVGGQNLYGTRSVHITGDGIAAEVINFVKPIRTLQKEDRQELGTKMMEVRNQRLIEIGQKPPQDAPRVRRADNPKKPDATAEKTQNAKADDAKAAEDARREQAREKLKKRVSFWNHPLLENMESKSLRELAHIRHVFFPDRSRQQINQQIGQLAILRVTIDADAKPGFYELRLETNTQLSNPIVFQVGTEAEACELEPNDKAAFEPLPGVRKKLDEKPAALPVTFNGQIYPGDTDRFRFTAKKGQNVVVDVDARSLIPYLADAVPGWFQAVAAVYDDQGNELAYSDDFRFDPDPALCFAIPRDGEYELEIRDSIYRGREDFVYRARVGEVPFVKSVFPLGIPADQKCEIRAKGWNLDKQTFQIRPARAAMTDEFFSFDISETGVIQPISLAILDVPCISEKAANDSMKQAQQITLGTAVDGRIETEGDEDVFALECKAGTMLTAEIFARRVNSPMDSLVRIFDGSGEIIAWNDDYVQMDQFLHKDPVGLVTHHADSYVTAEIPSDGTYFVAVSETQRHGGEDYAYRLEIREAVGDFALRTVPASLNLLAGSQTPLCVHVLRRDGFDGEILVRLKDAPKGFALAGGTIPAGISRARMTLHAPYNSPQKPVEIKLEGIAKISGKVVRRESVPAEDIMQAFLYRHLVPREKLMVKVHKPRWRMPSFSMAGTETIRLTGDGSARVVMESDQTLRMKDVGFELSNPPAGITLEDVKIDSNRLTFCIQSSESAEKTLRENLIVEIYRELKPNNKAPRAPKKIYLGSLPAIPIEIPASRS